MQVMITVSPNSPVAMFRFFLQVLAFSLFIVLVSPSSEKGQNTLSEDEKGENLIKGHLRPFGESGPRLLIEERNEFPGPADFLTNYVERSRPLKLSGVARNSRAVRLWSDDYLLGLDVPADSVVQLETKKKENREQETAEMHFHRFLRVYNQTEHYMVDDVPAYLRSDIMVPCSLQCKELMEKGLALALMWFSSGGTKSVIHTDAYDNINCLIRGEKSFVMVDPEKHRHKIYLRSDGSYSDIDVDSVDLTKYPAVAEMEFYHVNLSAGDCLFIPNRWIHQVRSYHSNVAVNFWWDHHASVNLLHQSDAVCRDQCNPDLTLDQMEISGVVGLMESYKDIRDWIHELTFNNPTGATVEDLFDSFKEDFPSGEKEDALEFFGKLDLNKDGLFTPEEHAAVPVETWKGFQEQLFDMIEELEEGDVKKESTRDEL